MRFLFLLLLSQIILTAYSQDQFIGLWSVERVQVGEGEMTPNSKWSRFNEDGSFASGNGWLQHTSGTYSLSDNGELTFIDSLGITDEFGGFKTSFSKDKMVWKRTEEGMEVTVYLKKISELPMAMQDYLVGMWELSQIQTEKEDGTTHLTELESKVTLYLRWDREYRKWVDKDRSRGYWHLNAHRPILTLINDDKRDQWEVKEVNETSLIIKGMDDENNQIQKNYKRSNTFPRN